MTATTWLGWIVVLLLLGWAVLRAVGSLRWAAATRALEARLEAARTVPAIARHDPQALQGLPPPLQRHFRTVLQDGQPIVAAARVEHVGPFDLGETADRWQPLIPICDRRSGNRFEDKALVRRAHAASRFSDGARVGSAPSGPEATRARPRRRSSRDSAAGAR